MITPLFDPTLKMPLYEQIYSAVRREIEIGALRRGEKLPSKRKLAVHAGVSQSTVENAYAQLMAEGYIESKPKSGYYVCEIEPTASAPDTVRGAFARATAAAARINAPPAAHSEALYDLRTDTVDAETFPFSVWNRLLRASVREDSASLLAPVHPQGNLNLRQEIARYLRSFRGMDVDAGRIILGAGTEYLLGLVTELLPGAVFAYENPGYGKTAKLLSAKKVTAYHIPMDLEGLRADMLEASGASVAVTTPSHHFPLGVTMSVKRRQKLLQWAAAREERYLIEDDFDGEFRFVLRPIPALQSLDRAGRVIYINSFAKTLAPSLRIAYMVLPETLLARYRAQLSFYSCTVSEFEQRIIHAFLRGGYYERHLNRMRAVYRTRRDALLAGLSPLGGALTVAGQNAGLHLLLRVAGVQESELVARARQNGVRVYPLSGYYFDNAPGRGTVIAGYAGLNVEALQRAGARLAAAWGGAGAN
ncbi:MAG: PLP-dependent aminotransferase family protein [Oscillospiraceae bacterium]|jgi:GntR family transcriptional regulator/MocR family aminotransferase|nr:PLP-dependent aminotransferase family protein [Oscillospiraceae bacterium]